VTCGAVRRRIRRVAELPLDRMAPRDPESPIYAARGEHLDELERALRGRG
jgi:hypothetical protein